MRNKLDRLALQVFNKPLLVAGAKLDTILSAVGHRILDGTEAPLPRKAFLDDDRDEGPRAEFPCRGILLPNGIAQIPIIGSLVRRGSWLDAESGLCSYAEIERGVAAALADSRVNAVLLEIDSPGGEASGCFELVRSIRKMRKAAGKPIWAVANDMACSGGYGIASAADQIWLSELGEVGSIGVVTAHVDMTGADRDAGLRWTYVTSGKHKVDGNAHAQLGDDVKAKLQAGIDAVYKIFIELVAENRGLSVESVRSTEAATYMGKAAIGVGLADSVGTLGEAVEALAGQLNGKAGAGVQSAMPAKTRRNEMAKKGVTAAEAAPVTEPEENTATVDPVETTDETVEADKARESTDAVAAATSAAHTRSIEIVKLGEFASRMNVKFSVAKAIASGKSVATLREQVQNAVAEMDDEAAVSPHGAAASISETVSTNEIKAGWQAAMAKAYARRGLKLPQ